MLCAGLMALGIPLYWGPCYERGPFSGSRILSLFCARTSGASLDHEPLLLCICWSPFTAGQVFLHCQVGVYASTETSVAQEMEKVKVIEKYFDHTGKGAINCNLNKYSYLLDPAFSRCSVGVVAHVDVFLMYLWEGR